MSFLTLAIAILCAISTPLWSADGGIRIDPLDPPWEGETENDWTWFKKSLQLTNETGVTWQVDGFRATWPNFTGNMQRDDNDWLVLVGNVENFDDGYGEDRWTIKMTDVTGPGENEGPLKTIRPGADISLNLQMKNTPQNNWEPIQPFQYLIKTGTFGNDYGYIDHPGIWIEELEDTLKKYHSMNDIDYYDENAYVPNSLGQRGGPYSGGFIDTWMTQDSLNPIPVTQLQVYFMAEDEYFTMNGWASKFRPDIMGQHTPAGEGPLYTMSLAMAQEYMNVDMHLMAAIGSHESMVGLEQFERRDGGPLESRGTFYCHPSSPEGLTGWNGSQNIGTMHYIQKSYNAYAWQSYRRFFPYDDQGHFRTYFKTPGSPGEDGYCGGNNATIANASFLNTLYMWYGFDLFYNSTCFDYRRIAPQMTDQEFAAKLFMASWNGGWNVGHEQLLYEFHDGDRDALLNNPDVTEDVANNGYVKKVLPTLRAILGAHFDSPLNPDNASARNTEIYDEHITKEQVAEFYFGMNVDASGNSLGTSVELGESGKLGIQGLLQHFRMSDEERREIWNSINRAYNMMKGESPSTQGTDYISLRYDWITLMRVVKYEINLDRSVPIYSEFISWVKEHSKCDRIEGINTRDTIYPLVLIDESSVRFDADGTFIIEADAEKFHPEDPDLVDYFDNRDEGKTIEWTLDEYWETWNTGHVVSTEDIHPDKPHLSQKGRYRVEIPEAVYREKFGDKPGRGWLRISDRNRNSVVQRFDIPGIKYPRFKAAAAFDASGDGKADSVHIHLIPVDSDDEEVFDVEEFDSLLHAWPSPSPLVDFDATTMDLNYGEDWLSIKNPALQRGHGLGAVKIEYPSIEDPTWIDELMKTIEGPMIDSVGPAVLEAPQPAYRMPANDTENDTLILEFSEPIADLSTGQAHLSFKATDGNTEDITTREVTENNGEYTFIFDHRSLIPYDSVRISPEGPVRDLAEKSNPAAPHNNWQPFISVGDNDPTFIEGYHGDTQGDGLGDFIRFSFQIAAGDTPLTDEDITHITYNIDGQNETRDKDHGDVTIDKNDRRVDITITTDNIAGAATGIARVHFSKEGEESELPGTLADRTGPAVSISPQPTYRMPAEDTQKDTLVLEFSEALGPITPGERHLSFKDAKGNTEVITTREIQEDGGKYTFVFDYHRITPYDSVRINPDGPVVDQADEPNGAKDYTLWRPIKSIGDNDPEFISASHQDSEGDGMGNQIYYRFEIAAGNAPFDHTHITDITYDIDGQNETIQPGDAGVFIQEQSDTVLIIIDTDDITGDATGEATVFFDNQGETAELQGSIDDRTGPALTDAVCLQQDENRDRDTLIFDVSEALANDISAKGTYFYLYKGAEDGPQEALSVAEFSHVENTEYRAVTDKNIIEHGDWIHFIHDSGIEDPRANPPLDINQKIEIDVRGGIVPAITEANLFDTRGDQAGRLDGHGDSLAVELRLSEDPRALTADDIVEVGLSWSGSDYTYTSVDVDADNRFFIRDNSITGGAAGDNSQITIVFKDEKGTLHERTTAVNDRIAPVIRSAAYERRESGDDILDVIFSEDLGSTGSSSPFDVDRAILPEVRLISHSGANAVYAIPQNADPLEFGDSLWIRGGEDIGDSDANEQVRDDNERVEISYRRVTELSGAYYLDTDSRPDGYIDEVILTFDTPLPDDISLSEDKIFLPGHRAFTIASAQNRGADHIVVAVAQDESEVSPQTVVTSEDILSIEKTDISDTLMIGTREGVQIADSLAPVAVRAVFMPVDDQGQDRLIDTLRVHFSEPVESLDRDVPFELSSPHTGTYRLIYEDFADEGAVWKAAVDYDNNDHFPAHGDSLWVYENGDVRDEEGSVQNRNTVPVPLELGRFDPGFRVGITPNPFAMENFDEDSLYLRVVEGRRPIPQDLRVRMTILDQVGNLIADFSPGDIGPVENNMITFGFKPQNRAGRRLGRGSYYAQIRLSWTSGEGASQQARRDIMIGIQEDVGSEESQDNGDDEGGE
ncbi:MAG: hypothetical protein ACQEQ4_05075 [Fibrobacterota bacterium]